MKKLVSLFMIVVVCLSVAVPVSAVSSLTEAGHVHDENCAHGEGTTTYEVGDTGESLREIVAKLRADGVVISEDVLKDIEKMDSAPSRSRAVCPPHSDSGWRYLGEAYTYTNWGACYTKEIYYYRYCTRQCGTILGQKTEEKDYPHTWRGYVCRECGAQQLSP